MCYGSCFYQRDGGCGAPQRTRCTMERDDLDTEATPFVPLTEEQWDKIEATERAIKALRWPWERRDPQRDGDEDYDGDDLK